MRENPGFGVDHHIYYGGAWDALGTVLLRAAARRSGLTVVRLLGR